MLNNSVNLVLPQSRLGYEKISIIVPIYNEQAMLPLFHLELEKQLTKLSSFRFEIIYINDGSKDKSWEILNQLQSSIASLHCIDLSRNFGKEAAVTAGFNCATGDALVQLDADLQDPPSLLPYMINQWLEGHDVVNMRRSKRLGESWLKRTSASLFYRMLNALSDVEIPENVGDFRLLSRNVIDVITSLPEKDRYMKGIMSWPGFKQTTLVFDRPERAQGETKWSFFDLVGLAISGITSFSVKPLKIATWLGTVTAGLAFTFACFVLAKTLMFGESVAGYPSLILIMLFLGGAQLLCIGLLGEYIARIFIETKNRPIYVVQNEKHVVPTLARLRKNG